MKIPPSRPNEERKLVCWIPCLLLGFLCTVFILTSHSITKLGKNWGILEVPITLLFANWWKKVLHHP
jgi:hypothetical protein